MLQKTFSNKTVLLTGHTGFKGSWMTRVLKKLGANVIGYSLSPETDRNLFDIDGHKCCDVSVISDIRDLESLKNAFDKHQPEIVIHMAAQPLVRYSYEHPVYTYDVNVMGTVNILECVRLSESVQSFVNVTTDKVYQNNEWEWGYRENEVLNGFDPYSNSKSCSELVTSSYINSFFNDKNVAISTARAGNVIGGGDFAENRIVPDCVRAVIDNKKISVRNPNSIRPYQHVLEPVFAYLLIAARQIEDRTLAGHYNVGPDETDCVSTGTLAESFCRSWGQGAQWESMVIDGPHEANFLKLDCSKIKTVFNWKPVWNIDAAVDKTIEWTKGYFGNQDVADIMEKQIDEYFTGFSGNWK